MLFGRSKDNWFCPICGSCWITTTLYRVRDPVTLVIQNWRVKICFLRKLAVRESREFFFSTACCRAPTAIISLTTITISFYHKAKWQWQIAGFMFNYFFNTIVKLNLCATLGLSFSLESRQSPLERLNIFLDHFSIRKLCKLKKRSIEGL